MSSDKGPMGGLSSGCVLNEACLKDKMTNLAVRHSDIPVNLSPKVRKPFKVLREIQSQLDELEANFNKERATLESKYRTMCQPLYAKRYDILNGVLEVEGVTNEAATEQEEDEAAEEKGLREFLPNAMKNNKEAEELQNQKDDDEFEKVNLSDSDIGDSFSKAPRKASTSLDDSTKRQKDARIVELGEAIKSAVVGIADEIRDLAACLSRGIEISEKQMRFNAEISEKELRSTEEIVKKQRGLLKVLDDSLICSRDEKHRASYLIGKSNSLINVFYSIPNRDKYYWVQTLLDSEKKKK